MHRQRPSGARRLLAFAQADDNRSRAESTGLAVTNPTVTRAESAVGHVRRAPYC